ncbi:hypothetical protein ACFOLL_14025 [Falsochrobactrum ovis]|uniref:Uncharacterized protein n=1 Tax=Falsochrobactrum ovis TaxID=1293442 RepID=A0A364JSA3_9HYPH|nr:hypothetical protein [Falsochrobactrum ovis]RAK25616.1 hypothetical protein C7374_1211 [Falsochrobactrum ovis]
MNTLFLLAVATPIIGGVIAFFVIAWPTIKKDRRRAKAKLQTASRH